MSSKKTDKLIQALHEAIMTSQVAQVKQILTENSSVAREICSKQVANRGTSLHAASARGQLEIVTLLVELGKVDINTRLAEGDLGILGKTALHEACAYGHEHVVLYLLSQGADSNVVEAGGLTPLHCACQGKSVTVIRALLASGADGDARDAKHQTPLQTSILRSPMDVTMTLVESGCDVTALDQEGQSALHYATEWGHEALIQTLLQKGALINQQDNAGRTPMHLTDDTEIRDLLIENGAESCTRDMKGRPAIESRLNMHAEAYVSIDHCLQQHRLVAEQREVLCNAQVAEAAQHKYNKLVIVGDSDVKGVKGNVMAELLSKRNVTGQ